MKQVIVRITTIDFDESEDTPKLVEDYTDYEIGVEDLAKVKEYLSKLEKGE